ncbi:BQ5605_C036g11483 [Microbotryum silenes-dioicae]|uniref:BQ5605_C036g11483 protein n=1 Tax=Microbotryum silenes-dioicae TaxID=796604 RepID=A0A2X0MJU0_9BASI|nr:BQ5605_C036g11483 [Microbotryum silenes-dioicae]
MTDSAAPDAAAAAPIDSELQQPAAQPQQEQGDEEPGQVDAEARAQLFEITLVIPSQSFIALPRSQERQPNKDNHLEIPLPSQLQDAVLDLRNVITESPEGFWLGHFGLRPIVSDRIPGSQTEWGPWVDLPEPSTEQQQQQPAQQQGGDVSEFTGWRLSNEGVLGEYADIAAVFGSGEGYENRRRGLKVVPTPYTALAMNTHLLRLRNILFSDLTQLSSNASYDPTSLAIGAGQTIYRDVRGQAPDDVLAAAAAASVHAEDSPEEDGKGKSKKGKSTKKQPASTEVNGTAAPDATTPAAPSNSTSHVFTNFKLEALSAAAFIEHLQPAASSTLSSPCVRALGISPWSPPPHARRLRGDHVYITLTTLEGESYTITGAAAGFWVSKITSANFDPSPRTVLPKGVRSGAYYSLVELLADLSPLFAKNLVPLIQSQQHLLGTTDIYATLAITHQAPAASWIVATPQHAMDPFRTQLAYLLTTSTTAEQLPPARDWTDEFAHAKEIPKTSVAERLMRERLTARTQADFVSSATRCAMSIARGDIPALNPNEAPEAHTYVHNNMLFTKAEDANRMYSHMGDHEAARYAAAKDVAGVRWLERADIDGLNSMATVLVDFAGQRWIVQSLLPGLFKSKEEEEPKLVDGEVENLMTFPEGDDAACKQAKAALEADKPFPSEVTPNKDDYSSFGQFRIVYGSANPEVPDEKVRASAYFDGLARQVADKLRFARHTVRDVAGQETQLYTSTDMHGIACPDGRSYFIDCFRLHCVDVEFIENDVNGPVFGPSREGGDDSAAVKVNGAHESRPYPHRLALLRMELLEAYHAIKLRSWMEERIVEIRAKNKDKLANGTANAPAEGSIESELQEAAQDPEPKAEPKADTDAAEERTAVPESSANTVIDAEDFWLRFNPDAFVERKPTASGEPSTVIYDADEPSSKAVRDASLYLREQVIPAFIVDIVSVGMIVTDGFFLTRLLHRKGINLRYLGMLADRIDKDAKTVDFSGKRHSQEEINIALKTLKQSVLLEMVIRASKHLLNRSLRAAHEYDYAPIFSHFLNCLLGAALEPAPSAEIFDLPLGANLERSWTRLTPASLRSELVAEIESRFRYRIPTSFLETELVPNKVLREVCLRVGVQLVARHYSFEAPTSTSTKEGKVPTTTNASEASKGGKKKKNAAAKSASPTEAPATTVFRSDDVLNVFPLVRSTPLKSQLADETFAVGQQSLTETHIDLGTEQLMEALQLCETVCGSVHSEVSAKYHNLGILNHSLAQTVSRRIHYHDLAESQLKEGKPDDEARTRLESLLISDIDGARLEHDTLVNAAVRMIRQSIIICERTNGLDSTETIQQYSDLGLLEMALGNHSVAMRLTKHAMVLWALTYGSNHPTIYQLLTNAVQMVQQEEQGFLAGVPLLKELGKLAELLWTRDSINFATVESSLAQAYVGGGDFAQSLEHMKVAQSIYAKLLPADAKDLVEATQFVNVLTEQLSQVGTERQAREERLKKKFPRLMSEKEQRQMVAQARARQIVSGGASTATTNGASVSATPAAASRLAAEKPVEVAAPRAHGQKGMLSVDELVNFIQGSSLNGTSASSKASRKRKTSPPGAAASAES